MPTMRTDGPKLGIVLYAETTGLDPTTDEIIELGMVAFLYDERGIGDVVGVFSALRKPAVPISVEMRGGSANLHSGLSGLSA